MTRKVIGGRLNHSNGSVSELLWNKKLGVWDDLEPLNRGLYSEAMKEKYFFVTDEEREQEWGRAREAALRVMQFFGSRSFDLILIPEAKK